MTASEYVTNFLNDHEKRFQLDQGNFSNSKENIPIRKRKKFQLEKRKYYNQEKKNIPTRKRKIFQLKKENHSNQKKEIFQLERKTFQLEEGSNQKKENVPIRKRKIFQLKKKKIF